MRLIMYVDFKALNEFYVLCQRISVKFRKRYVGNMSTCLKLIYASAIDIFELLSCNTVFLNSTNSSIHASKDVFVHAVLLYN